jgi:hypothetical protein
MNKSIVMSTIAKYQKNLFASSLPFNERADCLAEACSKLNHWARMHALDVARLDFLNSYEEGDELIASGTAFKSSSNTHERKQPHSQTYSRSSIMKSNSAVSESKEPDFLNEFETERVEASPRAVLNRKPLIATKSFPELTRKRKRTDI